MFSFQEEKSYTNEQGHSKAGGGGGGQSAETVPERPDGRYTTKNTFKMPVLEMLNKERCAESQENDK